MMFRLSLYYSENCSVDRATPPAHFPRRTFSAGGWQVRLVSSWPCSAAGCWFTCHVVWWSRAAVLISPRCCEWESEDTASPVCALLGNRRGLTSYFQRREGPSSRVNRATKSIFRIDYPSPLNKPEHQNRALCMGSAPREKRHVQLLWKPSHSQGLSLSLE